MILKNKTCLVKTEMLNNADYFLFCRIHINYYRIQKYSTHVWSIKSHNHKQAILTYGQAANDCIVVTFYFPSNP